MTGAIVRRLMIRGRVQGVGFRYAFADEAQARGLAPPRQGSVEPVRFKELMGTAQLRIA